MKCYFTAILKVHHTSIKYLSQLKTSQKRQHCAECEALPRNHSRCQLCPSSPLSLSLCVATEFFSFFSFTYFLAAVRKFTALRVASSRVIDPTLNKLSTLYRRYLIHRCICVCRVSITKVLNQLALLRLVGFRTLGSSHTSMPLARLGSPVALPGHLPHLSAYPNFTCSFSSLFFSPVLLSTFAHGSRKISSHNQPAAITARTSVNTQ